MHTYIMIALFWHFFIVNDYSTSVHVLCFIGVVG